MYTSTEPVSVVEKVNVLLAELREIRASGPQFRILHRFREPGCDCAPGEEIAAVYLIHQGREFLVPLSLTLRILFDFLARHPHLPQSATQIAAAMYAEPFYRRHGFHASRHAKLTRKISRSSVKEFVKRIRQALDCASREAGLCIDPQQVLLSQGTVTNEVVYRLKATTEWIHVDHPGVIESGGADRSHMARLSRASKPAHAPSLGAGHRVALGDDSVERQSLEE